MILRIVSVIALTLVYALALASFAPEDLLVGAVLASVLLYVYREAVFGEARPQGEFVAHIIIYIPKLLWFLTRDILVGTWQVTTFVLGIRKLDDKPGVIRVPLGNHSPKGVGVVGLFVTLSPGSFLVDIDWDERVMLIHYIDASDPARVREDVERYYRLWEYGPHLPGAPTTDDRPAVKESR